MAYQFPADVEKLVKDRMALGGYSTEDDVLRDALRALEEVACFRPNPTAGVITGINDLRREVNRGVEQLDRGEGRNAEVVFADLLRDLPNPDQV